MRVCQEVKSIITRGGRAVGVRVVDRSGSAPREVEHEVATVISDVGAPLTFHQRLLPTGGEVGRRTRAMRALIDRLQDGVSAVCLYLRLRAPVSSLGIRGENVWINATLDHEALSEQDESLLDGYPCHIYASFPSAKAGLRHVHTAEILSLVDCRAFQRWAQRRPGGRGPAYALLKQRISEGLLRLAETAIPGLRALVEYTELATPLTVEHFTSHPAGRFYGLAATPARHAFPLPGPRTPIQNLLLAGSDAGCLGVVGALMGGVAAASQALGPKGFPRIRAAIGRPRKFAGVHPLPGRKQRAEILRKRRLTPSIWKIELALEHAVDFVPGQFARVQVADCEWRDYSIASVVDTRLTFLIDTRTGGLGSQFVLAAQPGTCAPVELPLCSFSLRPPPRRKVFVATGSGLAPFLPMLRQRQRDGGIGNAQLLFGYGNARDDISAELDGIAVDVVRCATRVAPPPGGFSGQVSRALASLAFDPAATDFYLCGSAAMVVDCRAVLERRNACRIMAEAF